MGWQRLDSDGDFTPTHIPSARPSRSPSLLARRYLSLLGCSNNFHFRKRLQPTEAFGPFHNPESLNLAPSMPKVADHPCKVGTSQFRVKHLWRHGHTLTPSLNLLAEGLRRRHWTGITTELRQALSSSRIISPPCQLRTSQIYLPRQCQDIGPLDLY